MGFVGGTALQQHGPLIDVGRAVDVTAREVVRRIVLRDDVGAVMIVLEVFAYAVFSGVEDKLAADHTADGIILEMGNLSRATTLIGNLREAVVVIVGVFEIVLVTREVAGCVVIDAHSNAKTWLVVRNGRFSYGFCVLVPEVLSGCVCGLAGGAAGAPTASLYSFNIRFASAA